MDQAKTAPAAFTPLRLTLWMAGATALLHLLVAGRVGLGTDEAHYALYALHLDWSYFDHPPMVGWLQALVLPFSQSDFALRLMPVALAVAASLLIHRLAQRLFPEDGPWIGPLAAGLLQLGLMFQLIGLGMLPEAPLLVFALASMLALLRALERDRPRDWLIFGLCLGLAGLSKYTAVTLVVTTLVFIAWQGRLRILATGGPWLAALTALVCILPVLYWNAMHDWLSFRYQLGHGFQPRDWQWLRFARTQAVQAAAWSPVLYLLALPALWAGLREHRHLGVRASLALALPVFGLFAWGSGYEESLPHWTALGWAGSMPLMAHWLWVRRGTPRARLLGGAALAWSVPLILLLHSELFSPWLPFPEGKSPLWELHGWKEAADRATALRQEMATQATGSEPLLWVPNWSLAARLAWYARPLPVKVTDDRLDQFDLWFGPPRAGEGGVLVYPEQFSGSVPAALARFRHCTESAPLDILRNGRHITRFHFHLCEDYLG